VFGQLAQQHLAARLRLGRELLAGDADRVQLLRRREPVRAGIERAGFDLIDEPSHSDHEELVQVGAEDREELHPLQQRVGGVLRLFENPLLEGEQAQFAVDVERRIAQ